MRYLYTVFLIIIITIFLGCDSSDSGLCFENLEATAQKNIEVPVFTEVQTGRNIVLVVKSDTVQKVKIQAPEAVVDDVEIEVRDGRLFLEDNRRCDFFRESDATIITISTPNLTVIRNASQYEVRSDGVLNFESLVLISDDNENAEFSSGDFRLELALESLQVVSNNISSFFLSGTAEHANFGIFSGAGRLEAEDFLVNDIFIFHRGSNEMIIHPINSLKGTIFSVGDVVSKNTPEIIDVEELFSGRLRFE